MHHEDASGYQGQPSANGAGDLERWIASIGGGALTALGIRRGGVSGTLLALLGGGLVAHAITGVGRAVVEPVVRAADPVVSAIPGIATPKNVQIERSFTIEAEPAQLYRFWRSLANLPMFMRHLESVTELDERRSHWVAKAPAGSSVEWDAEIIADEPDRLLSWRSLEGADIENSGSVEFQPATGGRGTVVKVTLEYKPPAGAAGRLVASLFGEEPEQQITGDLRRFKQLIEAGEIATTEGQPHGTRSAIGKLLSPNN